MTLYVIALMVVLKCSEMVQSCTAACPCQYLIEEGDICQNPHRIGGESDVSDEEDEEEFYDEDDLYALIM